MESSLYKLLIVTNVIKICSSSIPFSTWPSRGCLKTLDQLACVSTYYCREFFNDPGYYYDEQIQFQEICSESLIFNNRDNRRYVPIDIKYKANGVIGNLHSSVPVFQNTDLQFVVISLDLSNNEYKFSPTLTSMVNLAKLNLSRNDLTEAKLSNKNELEKLTEIDFSYNTINTIGFLRFEHPYKNLKRLNMSHNYLAAVPDAVLDLFTEMESLDLSYNYVDNLSVMTFEGLRNLINLYLSHNRITDINSSLLRFNKLLELDLSNNRIENIKTSDFDKLSELKKLDLSFNSIVSVHKNAFKNLGSVNSLDLSNNALDALDKETFSNMSNLQNINLSNNRFTVLQRDLFKGKNISLFSITGNTLEGALTKGTLEGLRLVTQLDLSNQRLTSIEDNAFFGLERLTLISLNNNKIQTLSKKSFNTLRNLEILDLSHNRITDIEFDTDDLASFSSLLLKNNNLTQVKPEYFKGLDTLQFLDLSNNRISHLLSNSFNSLSELINFQISNNPLSGTLEENTFDGLTELPDLDISGSLLTIISNNSFGGMTQLKDLNISHSKINEIHFNSFSNTGAIEILDLSFNELRDFDVNTSELINLVTLVLNNNFLHIIATSTFKALPRLNKIIVSHNSLVSIQDEAFLDQKDLRYLDLSYNSAMKFNISQMEKLQFLASLFLSGIKTNITFDNVKDPTLTKLEMSNSDITNITSLVLKSLIGLENLVLSNNNIVKVEAGAFSNVTLLRQLDLSCNEIEYIQPGAFKDNTFLHSLNISHNSLTTVSYGIFRGLTYLSALDMSFNQIDNLESERFYEVRSLSELIVDHNKITSINADEFFGTSLSKLSLGDNPLPCNVLVNLKKMSVPFVITAIRLNEKRDENVDGITCNKVNSRYTPKTTSGRIEENNSILVNIRDILRNLSIIKPVDVYSAPVSNDTQYLPGVIRAIDEINKSNVEFNNELLHLTNMTSSVIHEHNNTNEHLTNIAKESNNTNTLLERMLKALTALNTITKPTPIASPNENGTVENLIPYINKIKQDLEDTIAIVKQNVLNEMESKISAINSQKEPTLTTTPAPNQAFLTNEATEPKSFIFVEICVGLILVILVGYLLYKFYNSGMFVPTGRSCSTRNLPVAMENSTL